MEDSEKLKAIKEILCKDCRKNISLEQTRSKKEVEQLTNDLLNLEIEDEVVTLIVNKQIQMCQWFLLQADNI